jgi:SDR family mycofactocin-dependent oxidoreductase
MRRVDGKVALVTGAGRGQGRSHVIRLAEEGADVIALDICRNVEAFDYPMASADELDETVELAMHTGRRVLAVQADVRDRPVLARAIDQAVGQFGRLDVVVANAGVVSLQPWDEISDELWRNTMDVMATGTWNTMSVSIPHLLAAGGGSMIGISSIAGLKGLPYQTPYVAAKHAIVGIARSLATELGPRHIRVNTIHPTGVDTIQARVGIAAITKLMETDPNLGSVYINSIPVEVVQPRDISDAVLFLASDESTFVTGLQLTVDAGNTTR